MSDIFISYKREERDQARAIAEALAKRGYDVWWDIELLPGSKFIDEIQTILKTVKCAIVLWSKLSVTSDFVRSEAELARQRRILIPIRLDDCEIPIPFNQYQTYDLSRWSLSSDDRALEPLIHAVSKYALPTHESRKTFKEVSDALTSAGIEAQYWKSISDSTSQTVEEYEAYKDRFGEAAIFLDLANVRIKNLQKSNAPTLTKRATKILIATSKLVAIIAAIFAAIISGYKAIDLIFGTDSLGPMADSPGPTKDPRAKNAMDTKRLDSGPTSRPQVNLCMSDEFRKTELAKVIIDRLTEMKYEINYCGRITGGPPEITAYYGPDAEPAARALVAALRPLYASAKIQTQPTIEMRIPTKNTVMLTVN